MSDHEKFMQRALELAAQAEQIGEVPVGAVLVAHGEIIAEGFNQMIQNNDPSAHAEIVAIRAAGAKLANYRLPETDLYVTLEPCAMCAGAMTHARIKRLIFATTDPRTGATGSAIEVLNHACMNHKIEVISGICQEQASAQLKSFFRARRKAPKPEK